MIAIASLILVVSLSILVTRVATIALAHTGMSKESARFQARSAFTGAGFTTAESEAVVNHPVRRRIVLLLMLLGNAGVVTAVSSLILTFVREEKSKNTFVFFDLPPLALQVGFLVAGLVVLWAFAQNRFVDRHLTRIIERALERYTKLDVVDYASVLHLGGENRLSELAVQPGDWLEGRTLRSAQLGEKGLLVLGIQRMNGTFLGAPSGATEFEAGDQLLVYGRGSAIEKLDERGSDRAGYEEHARAVEEQREVVQDEQRIDREEG